MDIKKLHRADLAIRFIDGFGIIYKSRYAVFKPGGGGSCVTGTMLRHFRIMAGYETEEYVEGEPEKFLYLSTVKL